MNHIKMFENWLSQNINTNNETKSNNPYYKKYKKIARQRLYKIRKELNKIHPDLDVEMSSQGKDWVQYWLIDNGKKDSMGNPESIIHYNNEYKSYIGEYEEEEFNDMIEKFKKEGEKYIKTKNK